MSNATNIWRAIREAAGIPLLQVADVAAVNGDGTVTVTLPGGGFLRVRGTASVGDRVFVKDGKIDGEAPDLPFVAIEE